MREVPAVPPDLRVLRMGRDFDPVRLDVFGLAAEGDPHAQSGREEEAREQRVQGVAGVALEATDQRAQLGHREALHTLRLGDEIVRERLGRTVRHGNARLQQLRVMHLHPVLEDASEAHDGVERGLDARAVAWNTTA